MGRLAAAATARMLIIDAERLPGLAPMWEQTTRFVSASRWHRLPQTICFAAKWYGEKEITFRAVWDEGGHEAMTLAAWHLYDQADIVIGYNQIKADNKWFKGDWLMYGMGQPRTYKNVDLYRVTAQFGLTSRSLAHLCHVLGVPGKRGHYDEAIAEAAYNGDVEAQKKIRRYNIGDPLATERCYDRTLAFNHTHPHVAVDADGLRCNRCGHKVKKAIGSYRAVVNEYAEYRCGNCGGIVAAQHQRRVARTRGVQ